MQFNLHPEKKKSIDEKGEKLLQCIKQIPEKPKNIKEGISGKFSFETHTFTDIYQRKWYDIDKKNIEVAIYFDHNNSKFGWFNEDFKSFEKLENNFLKIKEINNTISKECVRDVLFDWLKDKYINKINISLSDYALSRFVELIENVEIWIPINNLSIDGPLQINNILFKKLDEETINKWYNEDLRKAPANFDFVTQTYKYKIVNLKDFVFSIYNGEGDRNKSFEIAFEETRNIIKILHLFSDTIKNPFKISYVFVLGQENLQYVKHLIVKDGILITPNEQALSFLNFWTITQKDIKKYNEKGFSKVLALFKSEEISEYENYLKSALNQYLRICFLKETEYKLILIFSALETMFLYGKNENIAKYLSESIALFIGKNLEERKKILENLQKVYDLRSDFVHNANFEENEELLEYFFKYVWETFILLIENPNNFKEKKDLCNFIRDKRLT